MDLVIKCAPMGYISTSLHDCPSVTSVSVNLASLIKGAVANLASLIKRCRMAVDAFG